jgi:hypothetical protein
VLGADDDDIEITYNGSMFSEMPVSFHCRHRACPGDPAYMGTVPS